MCWKIDSVFFVLVNNILFSFVMWRTFQSFSGYGVFKYCMDYDVKSYLFLYFQVEKAHSGDVHCVDWNPLDVNYILTGYDGIKA